MSSSLRFCARGDICSSLRRPSRYLMSCQCVKNAGWPAREGVPGIGACPSGALQAAQGWALRRPASASAAEALLAAIRTASSANSSGKLLGVAHAEDRPRVVVADQQRAVFHLGRVDGPSPDVSALQPAFRERLVLRHVTRTERDHHDPEAELLRAGTRAALGEGHSILVLGREHSAG